MKRFRCIADCFYLGAVCRKNTEVTVHEDHLKMAEHARLLSRTSFVEISEGDAVSPGLSPAEQAELDMMRGRCKQLGIQFGDHLTAGDLKVLLRGALKPDGKGLIRAASDPAKPGAAGKPTEPVVGKVAEINAMDIEQLKEGLRAAGIPFPHNSGADKLRERLLESVAAGE